MSFSKTIKLHEFVSIFRVSRDEVKPILQELLVNLFKAFEIRGSEENEYIMKGR